MIDLSQYKKLVIGGVELKKLAVNGVEVWSSYTNWVPLSINADGTIYNGKGYKDGYRIRSGGLEGVLTGGFCTGFIKVNPGDVLRFFPVDTDSLSGSGNAVNVYDSGFVNLGQAASNGAYGIFAGAYSAYSWAGCVNEGGGVYRWTVPPAASGAVYVRISLWHIDGGMKGADMIVTINEEIA